MEVKLEWLGDAAFTGVTESGHTITMDGPAEGGGKNSGPRPMETVLLGMGACTSYDVMSILKKSRQDVDQCLVSIDAKRADEIPSIFTHIHVHFKIIGNKVKESQVARAIELSAEKYCSASIMLSKMAEITHSYEISQSGD
jgi:putative redox protein